MKKLPVLYCLGLCLALQSCGSGNRSDPYAQFAPPDDASPATHRFSGRLVSAGWHDANTHVWTDTLDLMNHEMPGIRDLPAFDVGFVQYGDRLLPMESGPIANNHNWWEWVFAPGLVWNQSGPDDTSVAAIPFALKETNEDCIHNGVMSFRFSDSGQLTPIRFQISTQTCAYLRFEMWGEFDARYMPGDVPGANAVITEFEREQATRLEARPIEELMSAFPEADPDAFGPTPETIIADVTLYGFIVDGIHYQGACETVRGPYPYCDELALPSYSTAKSLVGGLAMMRAEFLYPNVSQSIIADYVPECGEGWNQVTIEQAMDMTTGHYNSLEVAADEDAALGSQFFLGLGHADKVSEACNLYAREEAPGHRWVYHTSDMYLAGTALNQWLKQHVEPDADVYRDLVVEPLWKPLALSPATHKVRRTRDEVAQPFTGYGLTFYRNDVAKIARFLGADDGHIEGQNVLDRDHFDAVKGRNQSDAGFVADYETMRYNNGFRIRDVSAELGCEESVWITNLSGFGGINIILMPNDTAYYRFNDGGEHTYMSAVAESHRIRPMCD